MATTVTSAGDVVYASMPIVKWEDGPDGSLYVYGKATTPEVDHDSQVVESSFSAAALKEWLATAPTLRVQHNGQRDPAGSGVKVEVDRDGDGAHWVKSVVDEPVAQRLVRKGHLRAYSVGIANPVIERDPTGKARNGIITSGRIVELSLVDSPANKGCFLEIAKALQDGSAEFTGKMVGDEELLTKDAKPEAKDDGDTVVDPSDPGDPDDDSAPGSAADEDDRPDQGDSDDADDDAVKAYTDAVMLHKAAEPKRGEAALNGTEFLAKAAAWQRWAARGDEEGLDGTPAGYARWLSKRDFDPAVGGGVDRDKMPAEDFVDSDGRRFPIHSPGDVSDAVSSYGRANPKIPFKQFKRRLTAIARRKGDAFVAELPASWSAKVARVEKDITLTSPDPAGLVPYNLQGADENVATPDMVKGGKDCKSCGKHYDADSKIRRCEGCGAKLPKGHMTVAVEKGRVTGRDLPSSVAEAGEHREPDGPVEALEDDADLQEPGEPREEPDDVPASMLKAKKKGKGRKPAFPGAAAPFGKDSDGDDMATKSVGYTTQRMHDALCAAYQWSDVVDAYPALKSAGLAGALDPAWFQTAASVALGKGDMQSVHELAACHQSADTIAKGLVEPALLADARAQVHKSFADMYPTEHIRPGHDNVKPGMFTRPYISAGHAPLNASHGVTPEIPRASHTIAPDDYRRGLITAGHQAESPGDMAGNNPTGSVATGSSRQLYAAATKAAAETALKALHDRLAAAGPDMCPMAPSRHVLPPDNHASATPTPVSAPRMHPAPGEKSAQVTYTAVPSAQVDTTATYVAQPAGPDVEAITAAAVREVTKAAKKALRAAQTSHDAELAAVVNKMAAVEAAAEKRYAELQAELDELGAQPDPAQAPLRGAVRTAPAPVVKAAEGDEQPLDRDSVGFATLMAKSANPQTREWGQERLAELLTKSN